jgi:CheY-like chemotaxis protein
MANILVVEDRPNQRLLYKMALEDEGYQVTVVSNGVEALEAARKQPPDLILLDPCIPGLDREEVLKNVANSPMDMTTIIYSACDTFCQQPQCVADACLIKGSDLDPLRKEIRRLLTQKEIAVPDLSSV